MAKGDDIEDRLIKFGVRVIKVCDNLPAKSVGARHIRGQLVRSGTSPAPNYAEARGAESTKDFIHKLRIALKELNESRVWLQMIIEAELVPKGNFKELLDECDQLCRILSSSIHTAKNKSDNSNPN